MRKLLRKSLIVAVAAGVVATLGQPVHAQTLDPAEAKARADAIRADLDEATRAYNAALDELTTVTDQLQTAQGELEAAAEAAEKARELLRQQAVSAYQTGGGMGTVSMLLDEGSDQALDRIQVASVMASRQNQELRDASAVAAGYEEAIERFQAAREKREELAAKAEAAVAELNKKLEAAEVIYEQAEEEARRIEEERAAAARAAEEAAAQERARQQQDDQQSAQAGAQTGGQPAADGAPVTVEAAPVAAGVACPLEGPYSFIDSWGAPRSGGRSHKGTDIMAAHGKTVYAYTDGVISRTSPNTGLGGLAIYLQGDDGNEYYYAHLDSYSVAAGHRVNAGEPIGRNGSTGNASANAPHVHFEVHPGGGGAVNPHPFVQRACG